MKHKIYGVKDLKEWNALIHSGNVTMRVVFQGGANTKRGKIPATYDTTDAVKQAIIEKSAEFKHGKIYVVQSIEVPDDRETLERKRFNAQLEARKTEQPLGDDEHHASSDDGLSKVKACDKSEAIEWLKEHFPEEGYTAVKLRTMAAVIEAGKKHGVVFEVVG